MGLFLIPLIVFVWLIGFALTGIKYFAPRGIRPQDQHWIPGIVAIVWPVGLPLYIIVSRIRNRRVKGSSQGEYWEKNHNPWLD